MTHQEWKSRCVERIFAAVKKSGRVRIRDLKRATNYNRGPKDEGIALWYDALEHLEKTKRIVVQRDAEGILDLFAMTPEVSNILCRPSAVGR
jgi:hypothetical protein